LKKFPDTQSVLTIASRTIIRVFGVIKYIFSGQDARTTGGS